MKIIIILIPQLISIAYMTLGERKIMGSMQRRKGPDKVGIIGILQPISDGVKLIIKETIIISESNKIIFIMSPVITFILSILIYVGIPYNKGIILIEIENSILYIILISSLGIISIILAGWAGNSKYAIIGSLRTTAQMISYEIIIGIIIIEIIVIGESINIISIVEYQKGIWLIIPLSGISIILIISGIAETNRAPMDLPEAKKIWPL